MNGIGIEEQSGFFFFLGEEEERIVFWVFEED